MEEYITGTGQRILVHNKEDCKGEYCVIHNPSNHHMRDWPTHWREDYKMMERIDPEGVGHPDPDDLDFVMRYLGEEATQYRSVHGCNGLCNPEEYKKYIERRNKNERNY